MPLTVKSFDLLELLVTNHGRLMTKDELLARVWDGAEVYDSSLTTHVSTLRQILGDGQGSRYIETVPKKGYRFIAEVEALAEPPRALPAKEPSTSNRPASSGEHAETEESTAAREPRGAEQVQSGISSRRTRVLVLIALVVATFAILTGVYLRLWQTPPQVRLYREALEAEGLGNDNLALEKLKGALRLQPRFAEANLAAAWICYDDNDNETAEKYSNEVLNQQGNVADSLRLQAEGLNLLLIGDREDALNKLKVAADVQPTDPNALYELAELAVDMGLYEEADQALKRCKLADSANPFCAFEEMTLLLNENRFSEAISVYEHAEKNNVRFPWLHEPAGYAKLAQGDYDGALKHFRALEETGKELASNVHFRTSQEGIAAVTLYQGKLQFARQQILDALNTSKSNYDRASYYISLAEMDALHHHGAKAIQEVDEALKLSDAPDVWLSSVRVLAMTNQFDRASDILSKHSGMAGTIGKQYPAAERFLAGLRSASVRDWDTATAALENSYDLDSKPITAYQLAIAEIRTLKWNNAAVTLETALRSKGTILLESTASLIPLSELRLASCYEHLGNGTRAKDMRDAVDTLWKDADPELRAFLKSGDS